MIILGPVAVADNGVIGKNNDLPWHLPEDLKRFKEITLGQNVLMGRKTFESIFARLKKPLPGRTNIVVTRQKDYRAPEGVLVFHSLDEAVKSLGDKDVYIIGGAEIYKQALSLAEKFFLTKVKGNFEGDAFFPGIDYSKWILESEEEHDKFSFLVYSRKYSESA